jgi:GR25 family glycosyltransferase involved in LPS biosynthesis
VGSQLETIMTLRNKTLPRVMAEIGCLLGHIKAIRRLLQLHSQGHTVGLVFEDDMTPSTLGLWTHSLAASLNSLPPTWAIAKLKVVGEEAAWVKLIPSTGAYSLIAWRRELHLYGAGAYAVNLPLLDRLMHRLPFLLPPDKHSDSDLRVNLTAMPLYPCVVADNCFLDTFKDIYVFFPPLLISQEGAFQVSMNARVSTIQSTSGTEFGLSARGRGTILDLLTAKHEACTTNRTYFATNVWPDCSGTRVYHP